jgi:hypothetical protein
LGHIRDPVQQLQQRLNSRLTAFRRVYLIMRLDCTTKCGYVPGFQFTVYQTQALRVKEDLPLLDRRREGRQQDHACDAKNNASTSGAAELGKQPTGKTDDKAAEDNAFEFHRVNSPPAIGHFGSPTAGEPDSATPARTALLSILSEADGRNHH